MSCDLLSSGLCQDLQVERCQFLVHQAVSEQDPSVRHHHVLFLCLSCPVTNMVLFIVFSQDTLQVCQEVSGGSEWSECSSSGGAGKQRQLGQRGCQPRGNTHSSGSPGTEERPTWEGQRSAGISLTESTVFY